jgi:uncharacterized phage-associated protein
MAKVYQIRDKVIKMNITLQEICVNDVAKAFLQREAMTHKKLQKMCYYAYSWYLTLYKKHLFKSEFQAWIHGPVCPELYHDYKEYGRNPIPQVETIPESISSDSEALHLICQVYDSYGHLSGNELEYLSHSEDPWIKARNGLPAYEPSQEPINAEVIQHFYRKVYEEGQND